MVNEFNKNYYIYFYKSNHSNKTNIKAAEIIEWSGFAIACWSLPAAAFAWYTFSNIGPRAYKVISLTDP